MIIHRNPVSNYLQNIPLFSHFNRHELQSVCSIAELKSVKKNERIEIKKFPSTGIIAEGFFETGLGTRDQALFLYPGSFFGNLPYMTPRNTGSVKAVKDSKIIILDPNEINKILFSSYKGLRGYFRNITENNIETTDIVKKFIKTKSRVITIFSHQHKTGTSVFSGILGTMLSTKGKTIILDASYSNSSVLSIFNKEPFPALIQKFRDNSNKDGIIQERIIEYNNKLFLLNLTSGSRIKINTEILSPIISALSRNYKYIILDHSGYEKEYTNCIFDLSDIIFTIIKKPGERNKLYDLFDSELKEGQRIFYVLNRFFADKVSNFEGGYFFDDLNLKKGEEKISLLEKKAEENPFKKTFSEFTDHIVKKKSALIAETNLMNASLLSGFFSSLYDKDIHFDYLYSSSWSYLIIALFVLSPEKQVFEKNFLKIFSEDKLHTYLDVTFPEKFLFKNRLNKILLDMSKDKRLEYYNIIPAAMLSEHETDTPRLFSTGYMSKIFSASFLLDLFEPQKIADKFYYSGFPLSRVRPTDMLRTDVDSIRYVSVNNKMIPGPKKISVFSRRFLEQAQTIHENTSMTSISRDIVIDADIHNYKAKDILKTTGELCTNLI